MEKKNNFINESWLGRITGSRGTTARVQARKAEETRPINQADRDAAWAQYQKEEHDKKVNSYAQSNNLDMSKPGDRLSARWGSVMADYDKQRAAQIEANRAAIRAQAQNSAAASNSASSGAQPAAAPKPVSTAPAQAPTPPPQTSSTPSGAVTQSSVKPAAAPASTPTSMSKPNIPSGGTQDPMARRAAQLDGYRKLLGGGNPVAATGGNGTQTVSGVIRMGQVVN